MNGPVPSGEPGPPREHEGFAAGSHSEEGPSPRSIPSFRSFFVRPGNVFRRKVPRPEGDGGTHHRETYVTACQPHLVIAATAKDIAAEAMLRLAAAERRDSNIVVLQDEAAMDRRANPASPDISGSASECSMDSKIFLISLSRTPASATKHDCPAGVLQPASLCSEHRMLGREG